MRYFYYGIIIALSAQAVLTSAFSQNDTQTNASNKEVSQWSCDISKNPVVEIAYDSDIGGFQLIEETNKNDETTRRRYLRRLMNRNVFYGTGNEESLSGEESSVEAMTHRQQTVDHDNSSNHNQEMTEDPKENIPRPSNVISMRPCSCSDSLSVESIPQAENTFCPAMFDHCVITETSDGLVTANCIKSTPRKVEIGLRIWVIATVLFGIFAGLLVGTVRGWHAINHCLGVLCCTICSNVSNSRNEATIQHLLRRNRYLANEYIANFIRDHPDDLSIPSNDYLLPEFRNSNIRRVWGRLRGEDIEPRVVSPQEPILPQRHQLELKTQIYNKTASLDPTVSAETTDYGGEDDEGYGEMDDNAEPIENACTICFSELVHGDRVGSLPCNHLFHVNCLKEWLARRNVCPLCLHKDVATLSQHNVVVITTTTNATNDEGEAMLDLSENIEDPEAVLRLSPTSAEDEEDEVPSSTDINSRDHEFAIEDDSAETSSD